MLDRKVETIMALYRERDMLLDQIAAAKQDIAAAELQKSISHARIADAKFRLSEMNGDWFSAGEIRKAEKELL